MVGINHRRGLDHLKEKVIQEGQRGKNNQVRNRIHCYPGQPPQGESSLLVGMEVWINPFLLEMVCGLYSPSPVWGKSMYQGGSSNMDEAPEAR